MESKDKVKTESRDDVPKQEGACYWRFKDELSWTASVITYLPDNSGLINLQCGRVSQIFDIKEIDVRFK